MCSTLATTPMKDGANTPSIWSSQRTITTIMMLYHHHHVVPLAQISLTLSRHFSLLFIVSGRSSGIYPISSHSCCMYVLAGWCSIKTQMFCFAHLMVALISLRLSLTFCKEIHWHHFCLDYLLQMSINLIKVNSFTLKEMISHRNYYWCRLCRWSKASHK